MEKFSNKVFYLLILSVFCHLNIYAQNEQINVSKQDVVNIITKVNRYWQKRTSYKVRSFWDHAAYHTGNMEAYKLTKLEEFRLYSENWAEHNQWKGAKSDVKENWKYNYGETDYFVLFV